LEQIEEHSGENEDEREMRLKSIMIRASTLLGEKLLNLF